MKISCFYDLWNSCFPKDDQMKKVQKVSKFKQSTKKNIKKQEESEIFEVENNKSVCEIEKEEEPSLPSSSASSCCESLEISYNENDQESLFSSH